MKTIWREHERKIVLYFFVLLRFFPWALFLVNYGPQIAPDSGTYRYGFLDFGPLDSHRGPAITIPYSLMPGDLAISIFQWILLTFIGVKLLGEALKIESKLKYLLIVGIFSLLNSPTVSVWDVWILSHSLAISYNLFALYFTLKFCQNHSSRSLVLANLFILLSSLTRPNNIVFLFLFTTYSLYTLVRKENDFKEISKRYTAFLLIAFLLLSASINAYERTKWSPKQPIAILPYIMQEGVPVASHIIRETKSDPNIPNCTFPDTPLTAKNADFFSQLTSTCPAGVVWLEKEFSAWYLRMFLSNPKYAFSQFSFGAVVSLGYPTDYGSRFVTFLPSTIVSLFMGSPVFSQNGANFPIFFWFIVTGVILLVKLPNRSRRTTKNIQENNVGSLIALCLSMTISTIISIVYQSHGDSFRLYIDNQVLILLSLLAVLVYKMKESK